MLDVDALSATADGLIALAAEWHGDEEISHDGIASLRSGAIGDGEVSTLEAESLGMGLGARCPGFRKAQIPG